MKNSGAPSVGDVVEVAQQKSRKGLVVATRGAQVGVLYFKPYAIKGTPANFIWWIRRTNVKIISAA